MAYMRELAVSDGAVGGLDRIPATRLFSSNPTQDIRVNVNVYDQFAIFGDYVAEKLRSLDTFIAYFTQDQISEILLRAERTTIAEFCTSTLESTPERVYSPFTIGHQPMMYPPTVHYYTSCMPTVPFYPPFANVAYNTTNFPPPGISYGRGRSTPVRSPTNYPRGTSVPSPRPNGPALTPPLNQCGPPTVQQYFNINLANPGGNRSRPRRNCQTSTQSSVNSPRSYGEPRNQQRNTAGTSSSSTVSEPAPESSNAFHSKNSQAHGASFSGRR